METKFYKWSAPFSDGIDQVLMVYLGTSCQVNDFNKEPMIKFYGYEVDTLDMTPATKEEFIQVYMKVYTDMLKRTIVVF